MSNWPDESEANALKKNIDIITIKCIKTKIGNSYFLHTRKHGYYWYYYYYYSLSSLLKILI